MAAVLGWIVLGLVAGVLAKTIMPGKDPGGVPVTIVLGMAGSILGGLLGRVVFSDRQSVGGAMDRPEFLLSLMLAVVGSVILLALYRTFTRRRRTTA